MIIRLAAAILLLIFFTPVTPEPLQKTLQVLVEGEDPVMVELFGKELQDMAAKIGTTISLIDKETKPYDLRILLTSSVGSKTDSCKSSCSTEVNCTDTIHSLPCSRWSRPCSVTITIYFASAVVLKLQGTLQSADTGVGISRAEARKLLARKLVGRL